MPIRPPVTADARPHLGARPSSLPAGGIRRPSVLAAFSVRSFRFQFPADLLTSWAGEMEILILGWFILTATGSAVLLTVYGALQYAGTVFAPVLGLAGDRLGQRTVLCTIRVGYTIGAAVMTALSLLHLMTPWAVFALAAIGGTIRSSDLATRNALVAETMPSDRLMAAVGIARTTADSARIVGPLTGAALSAWFGMGRAYLVVTLFYAAGCLLTLGVSRGSPIAGARLSVWRDLREGLAYVWHRPESLAALWLAFLVNLTAFPLTMGLLPYVAREVYHGNETALGSLTASFAVGALAGSIAVSIAGRAIRPARMMITYAVAWYAMLLLFARIPNIETGRLTLALAGFMQSLSMVPMAAMLLHTAGARFRGRVMGVRMLAVYGLPVGLLLAGWLVERIGFGATATAYCAVGLVLTVAIGLHWRSALWPSEAPANAR